MKFAPLSSVRLDGGAFRRAQDLNARYLLAMDPERLLAPFRHEAGLERRAENYGNWESIGLDGHTGGHYLSAVSLMWVSTGRKEFRTLAQRMVTGLAECQQANESGYVGGVLNSAELWAEVATGDIRPEIFTIENRWVPWYNLHKTFAGLIDAYTYAQIPEALDVAVHLGDWWIGIAQGLDDEAFEAMLSVEFGGMNETFALLAQLTGRDDFLAMARRFTHRLIFEPLAVRKDRLAGLHANTQIPKAIGYQRVADASGEDEFAIAASFFWSTVVDHHSVAIGGNSVREHFHSPDDFSPMLRDREGPESCNTYNMVRLAGLLFESTGDPQYVEFVERALFNHVLSAQHPKHGGLVYFTSQRPGHYRLYSSPEQHFWCCVGTGIEANARHGAMAYAIEGDALAVELFIDSTVEWPAIGGRVHQSTTFPYESSTRLRFELDAPRRARLLLRVPSWLAEAPAATVNREPVATAMNNSRVEIDREWRDGDEVEYRLPMKPHLELLPDGSGWGAVMFGPIVLASAVAGDVLDGFVADSGRVGHIARWPLQPVANLPIISGEAALAIDLVDAQTLTFVLQSDHGPITLLPFSDLHDTRYQLYWPLDEGGPGERRELLRAEDARALTLDAQTIDVATFGEQQPEADHSFRGASSEHGRDDGLSWRRSSTLMQIELSDWLMLRARLRLELLPERDAHYAVTVDGRVVSTIDRRGVESGSLPEVIEVALADRPDKDRTIIGFRPWAGFPTDRLHEIRILRE
ncbi:beta-L-arabinofuranosidase domain-containing protein [Lacisediminihabitans sp.]|jgi:DUF1680 family protein|uniref:beta-L-arabinofuranosidase domain-containing protein n=1 Tax=Lacisediminihabitans sp. TaxID=2787631 RepID=UPI002F9417DA